MATFASVRDSSESQDSGMASKLKVNVSWNVLCLEQGISRSLLEFGMYVCVTTKVAWIYLLFLFYFLEPLSILAR